jgi:hypothetical protein
MLNIILLYEISKIEVIVISILIENLSKYNLF